MGSDGIERAAILLLSMGQENATEVLKHLEPRQVQKVGAQMSSMSTVSQHVMNEVVEDFLAESAQQASFGVDTDAYVRGVLEGALGQDQASPLLDSILEPANHGGLYKLKWLDSKNIAALIRNEHPQICATILTYLDPEQAADVVANLPPERRVDILMRMCAIDNIKPQALQELSATLEKQMEGLKRGKTTSIGGIKSVADVINYLDGNTESKIIEGITDIDAELSEKIQEKMFIFENLSELDDRHMQTLLRDVSTEVLMVALKGATERVKDKIFANMSKRAGDLLKDDLEAQGPVKVSEVEEAQREVLTTARNLAESGEISLGGKGEEMI